MGLEFIYNSNIDLHLTTAIKDELLNIDPVHRITSDIRILVGEKKYTFNK